MPDKAIKNLSTAVQQFVRDANMQPGQALKNGAIILVQEQISTGEYGNEYAVLAVSTGWQPFVVWRRAIGAQQLASGYFGPLDYVVSGSYHRDLDAALKDFTQSVERWSRLDDEEQTETETDDHCRSPEFA